MSVSNNKIAAVPPLVITLSLPHTDALSKSGTLLIQRSDLAHLSQLAYATKIDPTNLGVPLISA